MSDDNKVAGELKRVMGVVKVRNRAHGHALRFDGITDPGISIAELRLDMAALLTGHPRAVAALSVDIGGELIP